VIPATRSKFRTLNGSNEHSAGCELEGVADASANRETDGPLIERLTERARWIRTESMRLIAIARSGHYSSTFSCAELLSVLYYHHLRIYPSSPDQPDRDRFIMSKGHAAVGLYPILADVGFFDAQLLENYTRVGSLFADHPQLSIPGVDFGSGSLGHGLSVATGMALGARMKGLDFRVHCMLGDAELNEGQIWEAAMSASHYRLGNLVAVVDRNGMGLDGFTEEVLTIEPIADKWRAFGWNVISVDGHDLADLVKVYDTLPGRLSDTPTVIIARTVKGKGIRWMEHSRVWHLGALVGEDYDEALQELIRMSGDCID
jgi:transketolase